MVASHGEPDQRWAHPQPLASPLATSLMLCAILQVTPQRVQLCSLHSFCASASGTEGYNPPLREQPTNSNATQPGHKRHAAWTQLPGVEGHIGDSPALVHFQIPRCALNSGRYPIEWPDRTSEGSFGIQGRKNTSHRRDCIEARQVAERSTVLSRRL